MENTRAIKHFLVTGDTHGQVLERLAAINCEQYSPEETALIILGDSGINFYLNRTDAKNKENINECGFMLYCVRGNHEERPENIPTMEIIYDDNVVGKVYYEPEYPNIRYFMDGKDYVINGYRILVIGGAYSIDKWHRLSRAPANATWTGWFKDEQLTEEEMSKILKRVAGRTYTFVFSHTCPLDWEPTHLFLNFVDQSKVDKSMEIWLNTLKEKISFTGWLFGHYHADELVKPGVEIFFTDIENIQNIFLRCKNPDKIPWYFEKSPNYEGKSVE